MGISSFFIKYCFVLTGSEFKKLLQKQYPKRKPDNFSTSEVKLALKTRQSNKFGLELKNDREDIAKVLCKELKTDIAVEELFLKANEFAVGARGLENEEHQSNFVGLVGGAKVGKTTVVEQVIQHLKQHFKLKYVFYIDLKEVPLDKKNDLLNFLLPPNLPWMDNKANRKAVLEVILKQPESICFILDDLDADELKQTISNFEKIGYFEEEPPTSSNIILNILKGQIFSESKKLLVSRHFEIDSLPKKYKPAFIVNVMGFSRKVQETVCTNQGREIKTFFGNFKRFPDIHLLCAVPLNCKAFLELCRDSNKCFTYCNMFVTVFQEFLDQIQENSQMFNFETLANFAGSKFLQNIDLNGFIQISNDVLEAYFFDETDLKNIKLDKTCINSFFATSFCKRPEPQFKRKPYIKSHFMCLLMQDFFVAIKVLSLKPSLVKSFLSSVLHNISKDSKISNYCVVIIFLFGFCNSNFKPFPNSKFMKNTFSDLQKKAVETELEEFMNKLATCDCLKGSDKSLKENIIDYMTIFNNEK